MAFNAGFRTRHPLCRDLNDDLATHIRIPRLDENVFKLRLTAEWIPLWFYAEPDQPAFVDGIGLAKQCQRLLLFSHQQMDQCAMIGRNVRATRHVAQPLERGARVVVTTSGCISRSQAGNKDLSTAGNIESPLRYLHRFLRIAGMSKGPGKGRESVRKIRNCFEHVAIRSNRLFEAASL